jgi:hypothetical protein
LTPVFSGGQLAAAKTLHFERFFPHTGKNPVSVEIWEEDGQYHYVENKEPVRKNSPSNAPVPAHIRSLLLPEGQKTNN